MHLLALGAFLTQIEQVLLVGGTQRVLMHLLALGAF